MAKLVGRLILTVVCFAVVVPLAIITATVVGLKPTHWSGPVLSEVHVLPFLGSRQGAPEPAQILISRSRDQDADSDDVAPSYWDDDADEVVLGYVTPAGEAMRRSLGENSAVPYRIEQRTHSARALHEIQEALLPWAVVFGGFSTVVNPGDNRVELSVTKLGHSLFADLHSRYGDAVQVSFSPFEPLSSPASVDLLPDGGARPAPVGEDRTDVVGSWLTLATGFPWYLAGGLVLAVALWVGPPLLRRRRRPAPADPSVPLAA